MVTIHCDVYEKGDLLRILDYAKIKKKEDYLIDPNITKELLEIDLEKIERLKARVNGKYREDYLDTTAKIGREKSGRIKGDYQDKEREYKW